MKSVAPQSPTRRSLRWPVGSAVPAGPIRLLPVRTFAAGCFSLRSARPGPGIRAAANAARGSWLRLWAWILLVAGLLAGAASSEPPEPLGPSTRRTDLVISEIMYKPADRNDQRVLEYLELYNGSIFPLDLGGFQVAGTLQHTFASNTTLAGHAFLVVARAPADLRAVYQITNVVGWPATVTTTNEGGKITNIVTQTQTLPAAGEIKILNPLGATLLSVAYSDQPPWPTAADGGGHSLVLARPSLGEKNPLAWAPSWLKGGSPGRAEPSVTNAAPPVVINEFLARPGTTNSAWVELFNPGLIPVSLSGVSLSDSLGKNKFHFAGGTTLAYRLYL